MVRGKAFEEARIHAQLRGLITHPDREDGKAREQQYAAAKKQRLKKRDNHELPLNSDTAPGFGALSKLPNVVGFVFGAAKHQSILCRGDDGYFTQRVW
jgi:hypothetical protein